MKNSKVKQLIIVFKFQLSIIVSGCNSVFNLKFGRVAENDGGKELRGVF